MLKKNAIRYVLLVMFFVVSACAATLSETDVKKLEKYNQWKYAVTHPKDSIKVFSFFYNNPHWPLFEPCVKKAEENIKSTSPDSMILKWFKRCGPKTPNGIKTYINALLKTDKGFAAKYIQQTWIFQNLSPNFSKKFRTTYKKYLSPEDDAKRAKRLIDQKQYQQLEALNKIVIKEVSQYIHNYLQKNLLFNSKSFTDDDLEDIDKKYRIIQTLIEDKKDKKAANILIISNADEEKYANKFFEQRRHVACNILRSGNPELAYKILSMNKLDKIKKTDREFYTKAEWLLGFISYRFLKKHEEASIHFENSYLQSKNGNMQSKAAFWNAETCREKNNIVMALEWYKKACKHFNTFYGYLAYDRLQDLSKDSFSLVNNFYEGETDNIPVDDELIFNNRELVQVLKVISKAGEPKDKKFIIPFYKQLLDEIEDPKEELLLMELASSDSEMKFLVAAAADRQKYFNHKKAYRLLNARDLKNVTKVNSSPCFISLVHSIIHRESNFNKNALSNVGAVGLMQVMPSTATYETKRSKINIDKSESLFDSKKNITIGSNFISRLLKKYNNNLVYTIAAYNCGEANVSKFQKNISSLKNLTYLDVIELIPFKETRVYVKHVIYSMFVYQKSLNANKCYNCNEIINSEHSAPFLNK